MSEIRRGRRWLLGRLLIVVWGLALAHTGVATADTSASISGTVKDAQGAPITTRDICVQAFQPTANNGWLYSQSAVTDAEGRYTISGLQSGSYKVAFADCSQVYWYSPEYAASTRNDIAQYYSDTTDWEAASLVVLSAGGAKAGIDAQLDQATSISGHVYTSPDSSAPKSSECVSIWPTSSKAVTPGPLAVYGHPSSGVDGAYSVKYLAPNLGYKVEFYDCGYPKTYLTQFYNGSRSEQAATVLTPTLASSATGIDAHLTLGGKISGSVADSSGNPITTGDICVSASRYYDGFPGEEFVYDSYGNASSEGAGNYLIGGLAAGEYLVQFYDCNFYFSTRNDVRQYYNGQGSYGQATRVSVSLGDEHKAVNAALAPGTSISGHVYGSLDTSKPLSSVCVQASLGSETNEYPLSVESSFTDANGSYTIKHLPPDAGYKLSFFDCGGHGYLSEYYDDASTFSLATVLTPTLVSPITGIDAHLSIGAPDTEIAGGPANGAATNASSAAFAFASNAAGATFECSLDSSAYTACASPFVTGTLADGSHTFAVRASAGGSTDPSPSSVTWTVSPGSPTSTSQGSAQAGGTVSSDPGAEPSPSAPVVAQATLPEAGTVTMTKEPASTPSENGYTVFGQQLDIAATGSDGTTPLAGTVANPIKLAFEIDGSAIPAGTDLSTITVLRNGVAAPDCTGPAGAASPDPCVSDRTPISGGGVKLTVLTTHCSVWNFAVTPPPATVPGAGDAGVNGGSGAGNSTAGNAIGGVLGVRVADGTPKVGRVRVAGTTAHVPLSCKGASGSVCRVTLKLTVSEAIKHASKAKHQRPRVIIVGNAVVTLKAGQSKTVAIALNAAAKRLLAQQHVLKVRLTVNQSLAAKSSAVSGYTLTFKASAKKAKR